MTMSEKTSEPARPRSRWRKILWILIGIFIVPPALIFLILIIMIQVNGVRPDQMQPPPGMIKSSNARADRSTTGTLASTQPPTTFEDVLAAHPNPEYARIYKKLGDSGWDKSPMMQWKDGQPLTGEQIQWLKNNQGMINDLLELAKLGGGPIMTYEEIVNIDPFERLRMPVPNFLQHQVFAKILTAEATRRLDSGDERGATEALMAVYPISNLVREPFLIGYLVATSMQSTPDKQLASWLRDGKLSPEAARRLRDSLPSQALTAVHLRRSIEGEYQSQRSQMLQIVTGPIGQTMRMALPDLKESQGLGDYIAGQLRKAQIRTIGSLAAGTGIILAFKADGSNMVQRLDSSFETVFDHVDNNRLDTPEVGSVDMFHLIRFPNFNDVQVRANANAALLNLDVAGLDLIAGGSGGGTDPFNNQPLKTISEPESTLIYSLGPDGVDQRGAVTFDPTNGATSAGDICVRVKKKPR
ncbi:MAG: hypothetical protein ABFD69_11220 [Candidatus Sumerlaeia bacterium]